MGDFTFDFKESYRRLGKDMGDRIYDALVWCRDLYLDTPAIRASLESLLLLSSLFLIDFFLKHPVGLRMMYILPLWLAAKRGGRLAGYINVIATCGILTLIDLRTQALTSDLMMLNSALRLTVLAGLMAFIEHFESRLRKYATMARRDALTNALNRLGLDEYLLRAIEKSSAAMSPLTIAMIDCDKFKELNDEHGHEYGDHILKSLARLLRRYSQGGIVARNGGDEFVLVLPGRSPADAKAILNKVNWKFREATVLGDRCASFSFGLARLGRDGTTPRDLMVAADKDMYIHKASKSTTAVTGQVETLRTA